MNSLGGKTITGEGILIFNNINGISSPMNDLANNSVISVEWTDDKVNVEIGKNNSMISARVSNGVKATLTVRALIGGKSDLALRKHFLNNEILGVGKILLDGTFYKSFGDGSSGIAQTQPIVLSGFDLQKMPKSFEDTSGDTDQAVNEYILIGAAYWGS